MRADSYAHPIDDMRIVVSHRVDGVIVPLCVALLPALVVPPVKNAESLRLLSWRPQLLEHHH